MENLSPSPARGQQEPRILRAERVGTATLYLADCVAVRHLLPPADAVVSDPPYGIGLKTDNRDRAGRSLGGTVTRAEAFAPIVGDSGPFDPSPWLGYPSVVLWGANHYAHMLPAASKWLVWDKREGTTPDDNADVELAWTNLGGPARMHRQLWRGICRRGEENVAKNGKKLHPAQKPV